jgi:alginate O-acetyltransferase complex protein AlgI
MVFSSVTFLFFFLPIFLTLYFLPPFRGLRNAFILLASLIFYAWGEPVYVVLMIFSILTNYLVALGLAGEDRTERKMRLLVGLSLNLATLIAFKYADFIILNINVVSTKLLGIHLPPPEISLPLGISFFTFQAMSYLFDVYRREAKVEKNPFHVAL